MPTKLNRRGKWQLFFGYLRIYYSLLRWGRPALCPRHTMVAMRGKVYHASTLDSLNCIRCERIDHKHMRRFLRQVYQ